MIEDHLADYLQHKQQAAMHACAFVEGFSKADFLADKPGRRTVIMCLFIKYLSDSSSGLHRLIQP